MEGAFKGSSIKPPGRGRRFLNVLTPGVICPGKEVIMEKIMQTRVHRNELEAVINRRLQLLRSGALTKEIDEELEEEALKAVMNGFGATPDSPPDFPTAEGHHVVGVRSLLHPVLVVVDPTTRETFEIDANEYKRRFNVENRFFLHAMLILFEREAAAFSELVGGSDPLSRYKNRMQRLRLAAARQQEA